jgi:FixJ family two-component response regulator
VIIDDDDAGRDSLQFALQVNGYETEAFPAKATPAADYIGREPCIVIEQALESTTGLDLVGTLRRRGFAGPVILTAFEPGPQLRSAASRAGVTLLERPLLVANLIHCIEALTNSPGQT